MKVKTICVNYKGRKIQIEGYDADRFIRYCDLSLNVKPFNHTIKRVMYVCDIQTSVGIRSAVLCASCYRRFKNAKWFHALIERIEL